MQRVHISPATYPHLFPQAHPCAERQKLLKREQSLRAQSIAKSGRNDRLAAELGQFSITVQKTRFAHEEGCAVCLRFERGAAA